MKKKILSSLLMLMFTSVAVGALDCGCVFASMTASLSTVSKAPQPAKSSHCHSSEQTSDSKNEGTCCVGCQLQRKAPSPPNIELSAPLLNKWAEAGLSLAQRSVSGGIPILNASQGGLNQASFLSRGSGSVPIYGAPIYLTVQTFLI